METELDKSIMVRSATEVDVTEPGVSWMIDDVVDTMFGKMWKLIANVAGGITNRYTERMTLEIDMVSQMSFYRGSIELISLC
ncbi:hypothetical protein JTB14_020574 [Gonioctena quinquepunctata]|nr:hypothetical protein JTB14_020574 [Gonioctena quinquepunctata]